MPPRNIAAPEAGTPFPGFDGLRLLAAAAVLFSHAFLIATGAESREPFVRLLGAGNILGLYGVYTFFIISGFLLARSLAGEAGLVRFAINRALRIYPGFLACILVMALVIGPLGSGLALRQYFADPGPALYVATTVSCLCGNATLPGVFAYLGFDDVRMVVNGSLWSLRFEVLSYLLLAWLWLISRDVKVTAVALAWLATAVIAMPGTYDNLPSVNFTLPYFAGGVLMYAVYLHFGLHARMAGVCLLGLLAAAAIGVQIHAYAIFGAYLVVYLGARPNVGSALAMRVGDLSYGVYLYGWPVEQLVKRYTGTENPWLLMSISLPVVLVAAALSCHLVERPVLRLKAPLARLTRGLPAIGREPLERAAKYVASAAFLVAAFVFLVSEKLWWYVTPGLAAIAATSALGALIGGSAAGAWLRLRKPA